MGESCEPASDACCTQQSCTHQIANKLEECGYHRMVIKTCSRLLITLHEVASLRWKATSISLYVQRVFVSWYASYNHIHGTHSSEGKRRQGKKHQWPRSNLGPMLYHRVSATRATETGRDPSSPIAPCTGHWCAAIQRHLRPSWSSICHTGIVVEAPVALPVLVVGAVVGGIGAGVTKLFGLW